MPLDVKVRPIDIDQPPSLVFPRSIYGTRERGGFFAERVNEYNERNLTYDSDTLNAFLGILRSFEKESPGSDDFTIYHCNGVLLQKGYQN